MISRKVDPNEAPEGFYAESTTWDAMCEGCAFESWKLWVKCPEYGCTPGGRKDMCHVVFKKKEA